MTLKWSTILFINWLTYITLKTTKNLESLKRDAYDYCFQFVSRKLDRIQVQIRELEQSLTSETKSSAGDKHETGRAMIQLEREKLGQQLSELEKTQQATF